MLENLTELLLPGLLLAAGAPQAGAILRAVQEIKE